MAISKEQSQQDEQDFGAAYDEDLPTPQARSDDDAFGLVPDESVMAEDDGIPNSPEEAQEAVEEEATDGGGHPPGLTLEEQRAKSWEGRKQAQAREAAPADDQPAEEGQEANESPAEEAAEPEVSELLEDAAEKTEGMSPDEALKALAADFGEDFAKMLSSIIDAKVAQVSDGVSKSVNEIIDDIVDTKAKAHFEAIADRHPDFMDIAESEEFKAYCAAKPECSKVVESGTAREINKMLDGFVASKEPKEDSSMDAAEGVRSSGMRLPQQPSSTSDYSAAWDEA